MNARLLVALALVVVCAVAVRGEEESALAGLETVEPTFLEADSESSPLFQLPKKLAKTTVEPRYYGEKPKAAQKYVSPEYQDPKPVSRKQRKNAPVLFTSHYFSPLPKKVNGKKLRVSRQKRGRLLVPFRATVETPAGHRQHKGFTQAELWDGRLPNKYDDPRQNMKKTKAPAPQLSLLETLAAAQDGLEEDTTDAAEAEAENAPVPPPFQHDEGEQQATIVESAEGFFDQNYQPPTWKDEDSVESELIEAGAEADVELTTAEQAAQRASKLHLASFAAAGVQLDQSKLPRLVPVAPHVSAEEAVEQYNDLAAFLEAEDAKAPASFVEVAEETEDEDEEESEDEESEDSEDGAEADEEADSDDEEVVEEVSLMETAAAADEEDSVDAEMDEMAQNEQAAAQIDMDATSDEAAMADSETVEEETVEEVDSDEESSAEEADAAEEEVSESDAVDEAEVADAVSLVEVAEDAEEVDTLLNEVDAHLTSDSDAETQQEVEADAEGAKGTPGSRIAAGQTWEDAQNERLNAMEQQLAAEKAAAPKVAAQVVSAQELSAVDAEHQLPTYDSAEAQAETVEPELLVETSAKQALAAKMAQLKAINRS